MSNTYGIPSEVEDRIRMRDERCVYCHKTMTQPAQTNGERSDWATIEHFDNDGPLDEEWNIGICCWACNSSKGTLSLSQWFESPYCKRLGIHADSVSEPVRQYLRKAASRSR